MYGNIIIISPPVLAAHLTSSVEQSGAPLLLTLLTLTRSCRHERWADDIPKLKLAPWLQWA